MAGTTAGLRQSDEGACSLVVGSIRSIPREAKGGSGNASLKSAIEGTTPFRAPFFAFATIDIPKLPDGWTTRAAIGPTGRWPKVKYPRAPSFV